MFNLWGKKEGDDMTSMKPSPLSPTEFHSLAEKYIAHCFSSVYQERDKLNPGAERLTRHMKLEYDRVVGEMLAYYRDVRASLHSQVDGVESISPSLAYKLITNEILDGVFIPLSKAETLALRAAKLQAVSSGRKNFQSTVKRHFDKLRWNLIEEMGHTAHLLAVSLGV
jgi:hypothetical protein